LCSYIWVRASAAKGWPVLSPHINKQSIVGRLKALGPLTTRPSGRAKKPRAA
jgi:hypothetical protein